MKTTQPRIMLSVRNFVSGPSGGRTVLVDCTADWCPTCKTLEATCLNAKPVRELVAKNRVLTLTADWTHEQPEVTELLEMLGNKAVPTVAVFPANDPNNPIVFRGWYTQQDVVDALNKAGPSRH